MFKRKKSKLSSTVDLKQNSTSSEQTLCKSLEDNTNLFKKIFKDDETIIIRHFENQQDNSIKCCILFAAGMVNNKIVNENIIQPIVSNLMLKKEGNLLDKLQHQVIISNNIEKTPRVEKLVEKIFNGNTILFAEGSPEALTINTKEWKLRAIEEPETEKVLRGPREGFTESLLVNLTLIRRKLKTPDLKFKFRVFGTRSRTKACICYIEGLVNKKILKELDKRLDGFDMDSALDSNYIQEFIKDSPFSPFKTTGITERPDIVAAKLLEGRIAFVLDGTPAVMTVPHIFLEYFQSNDDYYINFYFSSIGRILRILGFILTISIPAIYLALVTYHQEMIPTQLALSIYAARQDVPFPTIIELLIMLFVFEILRETGLRMPANIGQALSIVGALVLGQAAVEAKLVSAPIVIVVGLTGITGLLTPRLKGPIIIIRVVLTLLTSVLGLYGYIFGIAGLLIHLFELRSFSVPFMSNLTSLNLQDLKDTAARAPWWYMKYRTNFIAASNLRRKGNGGSGKP